MRKLKLVAMALVATMVLSTAGAFACTGLYVGKDVCKEGTTLIARSEDQGSGAYNKMFKVQPRVTKAGRYFVDEGEDQNGFKVPLPKTTFKYTYVPDASDGGDGMYPASCMNEYGLAVVGTISTGVSEEYEAIDPAKETGTGLREAILPGLIACQAKTAREAAEVCAKLHDEFGSEEWNTLLFSDPKESWIFENYGGYSYAAMKMPTDKVAVFGNQIMIDWIDPSDTENVIVSKNLIENLGKLKKVVKDDKGRYNLVESIDAGKRSEYSNMRTWRGHQTFAPSKTGKYSDEEFYTLFFTPDNKVSVIDVMKIFGDRYEGTEFDMMKAENEGRRPIGVTRQSDVHIMQTFPELPIDSCHVQWLAMGNAEHSMFLPTFAGITDTYKGYHVDLNKFNPNSMYFASKRVNGLAESDREFLSQGVKDYNVFQEEMMLKDVQNQLAKVKAAYKISKKAGRDYVTKLGIKVAEEKFKENTNLFNTLSFTQINNINDRTKNARKTHFVADTKLVKAAKFKGYTVKKVNAKEAVKYVLTKGDKKITLTVGSAEYTLEAAGNTTTEKLTHEVYMVGKFAHAPMDFVLGL